MRLAATDLGSADLDRLLAAADKRQNPIALQPAKSRELVQRRPSACLGAWRGPKAQPN